MNSVPRSICLVILCLLANVSAALADEAAEGDGAVDSPAPSEDEAAPSQSEGDESDGDAGQPSEPSDEPPEEEEPPVAEEEAPIAEEEAPPAIAAPPVATGTGAPPSLSKPLSPPPPTAAAEGAPPGPTEITTVPAEPLPPEPVASEAPLPADDAQPTEVPLAPEASVAPTDPPVDQPAPVAEHTDDEEQKFSPFSFSPQIGYAFFPESTFEYDGLKFNVDNRNSFVLKLHLDLGGDGLAFELVPLLAYQKIGGDINSFGADLSSGVSGSLLAAGGQMNIMVRGSWGSFFPHLGIGFHAAYLFGDGIEYGADIYGRIPAGFTWYIGKHFGIVAEFAFMLGVTGIRKKIPDTDEFYADLAAEGVSREDVESLDWNDYDLSNPADKQRLANDLGIQVDPSEPDPEAALNDTIDQMVEDQVSKVIQFGRGYGFEFMVGFRFP